MMLKTKEEEELSLLQTEKQELKATKWSFLQNVRTKTLFGYHGNRKDTKAKEDTLN